MRHRPDDLRARAHRRVAADPHARHGRVRADRLRGRDVHRAHAAVVRRARPLAAARQPGPTRQRPPDGHRARPARRLQPPSRPLRRDPRAGDRHARQSGRASLRADRKGALPHDRHDDRRTGAQLRRRRVARERRRRDVREAKPVAAVAGHRRLPGVERRGRARCDRGGARGVSRLGVASRRAARGVLRQGRGGDRGARRAGRPGHDRGDGQAAPRGAARDAARRDDPPLRGRRGLAADRRAVRAVRRRPAPLSRCAGRSASSGSSRRGTSRSRSRSGSSRRR